MSSSTSKRGVPVRANGVDMSMLELIESLEIIAGAHGVGRIDVVENRLAGIKEREVYEAPPPSCCTRRTRSSRSWSSRAISSASSTTSSRIYADLVYSGQWFSHTRQTIDAFVAAVQPRVTGAVRLKLFKGDCRIVGRKSPYAERCRRSMLPAARAAGRLMAHLWSGRFEGSPDAALFEFGASFRFDRRLFEDDVQGQPRLGGRDSWRRRALTAGSRSHQGGARRDSRSPGSDPAFFDSAAAKSDEDVHSFVERELVAARRRRRPPPAHRAVAKRTGRASICGST